MNDPDIDERSQSESSGLATFVIIVSAIALAVATTTMPDLAWVFATLFLVVLFICFRGSAQSDGRSISRKYARKESVLQSTAGKSAVVEAMQHPVLIVDAQGQLRFSNSASHRVFGRMKKGERIFIRFRQPDLKRVIEQVLSSGVPGKTEYHEPVPTDRWFAVEVSPIRTDRNNSSENDKRFIVSFLDLTETKRIDQMRSDFIANASHELRTPLASLLGYLETLKGPAKNDAKASARFVDIMLEQAERMSRLVNDLLSLSRIEMKSHVRPNDTVNLNEVLATVINALEPMAEQLKVEIMQDLPEKCFVRGDRDELVQVFENIIENACKYGQDGGRVEVVVADAGDAPTPSVSVSVRDFGPGIAEEHQQRITERFYRVDVARSREKQGTGLGLAIVKHILQRHGTRLQIRSKPDQGAEFVITLELAESVTE